jgi:hypothetical protein
MAFEDFTPYSETDPNSDITITANSIAVDTMRRDAVAFAKYIYPADTFGDFVHIFKVNWTGASGTNAHGAIWMVSNSSDTIQQGLDNNEGIGLWFFAAAASKRIQVYNFANDAVAEASWATLPGIRYVQVQRIGTVLTVIVYTDEARTAIDKTLTLAVASTKYSSIIPVASRVDATSGTVTITYDVENLDLGFVSGTGGTVTVRSGDGIKARSSSITPPVQQARKPYLHLKNSMKDFFTEHVRFIKTLNLKESVFEKPYLDVEYPSMHLSIPAPDWPTWDKFKPKPGDWPAGGLPVNKGIAPNCPAGGCLLYADWTTSQNDCEKVPVEIHAAVWCTFYPADSRDCVMKIWAKVGAIKEVVYPGGLQFIGPSIDAFVDPNIDLHLICGSMVDGVGHYCEECIEVVCKCNCDSVTNMTLDAANTDDTIAAGGTATVTVKDGCGPFSWSVSGTGYVLDAMNTEGRANRITCIPGTCGTNYSSVAVVTVTDACGTIVTKSIKNTAAEWVSYTLGTGNNCNVGGVCTCPTPNDWGYVDKESTTHIPVRWRGCWWGPCTEGDPGDCSYDIVSSITHNHATCGSTSVSRAEAGIPSPPAGCWGEVVGSTCWGGEDLVARVFFWACPGGSCA